MVHIQAVVPVLNEETTVDVLVEQLAATLEQVNQSYGIIIVDDGSTDNTWQEILSATKKNPKVHGIRFSRNFGQHQAITAGLNNSDADWVVVMDGDLQDRPEVIPDLYAKAGEGYDVVFVSRSKRPEGLLYTLLQRTFYSILRFLSKTDYDPAHGNFSIVSRRVINAYKGLNEGARFYGGLVSWLGFKKASIEARHGERYSGRPSYNFRRRLSLASDIILAFSVRPLHAAIIVGILSTVFSFSYGIFILMKALISGVSVEGWASLIVSIYFVGGIIMTLLGMNSLYLGKVYEESQKRPLYVVADTSGIDI